MSDFNEMLQKSYETISDLQSKLEDLDKIYIEISQLKEAALKGNDINSEIPNELKIISEKYLKQIGVVTENYISINNKILETNQVKFHDSNERFEKILNQLKNVDLKKIFEDLKVQFLKDLSDRMEIELSKIDEKTVDFQTKIDALQTEVERLEKIDLVKEFDKLQATLASIFTAINSLNTNLASVVSTLTGIVTSLGTIQTKFTNEFIDLNKNINKLESNILDELVKIEGNNKNRFDSIDTQFTAIDKDLKSQFEKINTTIDSIVNQNNLLNKEIKTNRIILFIGSVISFCLLIYLGFLKK